MSYNLTHIIEAVLLSASRPLAISDLVSLFEDDDKPTKDEILNSLREIEVQTENRGIELKKVSSGYRLQVKQDLSLFVAKLWEERPNRLSKATLETLALVAYRQPITRGEIEDIRGVSISTQMIRGLVDRGWIKIVGRRDVPGKPSLYATTRDFLDYFGLQHLRELPNLPNLGDSESLEIELQLENEDKREEGSQDIIIPSNN